jgi:transcriptional regulator with XRE-family HTH domain
VGRIFNRQLAPLSSARLERLLARVTLRQLAHASGLSLSALSRGERSEPPFTPEQEERRLAALERLRHEQEVSR